MGRAHTNAVEVIARRLATVGLPGASDVRLEISEADWPRVLGITARQRITGLASAAVRDGWLHLSVPQRAELEERHRSAMAMVLVLDQLLIEVSEAMAVARIQPVVLKGPSFADAFYPDRSWRSYGDLDLLVSAADWRNASGVLSRLGFERIIPEPRPGFDERWGKGASFEDVRKLQVDLHRTLALGSFGLWIDTAALLDGTTTFSLQGR